MRIAGRVPPPAPAPVALPPMPKAEFDPSKIPASIRPQPTKLAPVPGSGGLSVHPALLSAVSAGNGAPSMPSVGFDPNKIPESVRPHAITPGEVPVPGQNQNLVEHLKQRAAIGNPTDPSAVDPKTGKPMYKMGTGQRVLGTIANALQGFGRTGAAPINVGPGATNWRYDRDEAMRQGKVANLDTQIKGDEQLSSENEKLYRDVIRQAYEGQVGEARQKLGSAAEENAATKATLAQTQAELNTARANKLDASPADQRTKDADAQGLTGQARKDYILTGKLPKDFAGAGRAPSDLEMWHSAFVRDNKREPTAEEISNRRNRTDTKADQITKDRDAAIEKAEAKARDRIEKLGSAKLDLSDPFRPGESMAQRTERHKQAIYTDLEKEKAAVVRDYQERAAQNASNRGTPAARPGAAPSNAASKIDPNNLPRTVMVNGKIRSVAGWNPNTKKVIVAPSGQ